MSVKLLGPVLVVLASIVAPSPLAAQTANPNVIQFIPSADHSTLRSDGRPVVSRYDLTFYQAGTGQAVLSVDLGKPARQADGMIRIDLTTRIAAWPLPGVPCDARVAAIGPDGNAVSDPSNEFVYVCNYSISSTSRSFTASGGTGTVQVSSGVLCGWSATSSASWITVTSGAAGAANGSVAYTVAPNAGSSSRTGTLTIAGRTHTITQSGGSGGGTNAPPSVRLTTPVDGHAYSGSLQISAAAADSDGSVARVELLVNGSVVRTLTAAPYAFLWTPPATGSYSLTAHAYDNAGARATSAAVDVAIVAPRYLGDVEWASMTNGWGPAEKNRSNGEQGAADGRTITLNGRTYARGIGAHARSEIRYRLNGTCSTLQADIGLDDETGTAGSVVFEVWADGAKLFESGVMRSTTPTQTIAVGIAGRSELALVITDAGDDPHSDHGDWADARVSCTTTSAPTTTRYLSDLPWISATNGWGPVERDRSNGEQGASDGRTITLNGQTYAKGLGAHARSDIRYALNGACSAFQADVGLDDETGLAGSVVFEVWADGTKLFDSGVMGSTTATRPVNVNVTGRRELSLVIADAGDHVHSDHGDWANARVVCSASGAAATTVH